MQVTIVLQEQLEQTQQTVRMPSNVWLDFIVLKAQPIKSHASLAHTVTPTSLVTSQVIAKRGTTVLSKARARHRTTVLQAIIVTQVRATRSLVQLELTAQQSTTRTLMLVWIAPQEATASQLV